MPFISVPHPAIIENNKLNVIPLLQKHIRLLKAKQMWLKYMDEQYSIND